MSESGKTRFFAWASMVLCLLTVISGNQMLAGDFFVVSIVGHVGADILREMGK